MSAFWASLGGTLVQTSPSIQRGVPEGLDGQTVTCALFETLLLARSSPWTESRLPSYKCLLFLSVSSSFAEGLRLSGDDFFDPFGSVG